MPYLLMPRILTTIIHIGRKEGLVCQSIHIVVKIVVFNSTANSILTILCLSAARSVTRTSCARCSCQSGSYSRAPASIRPTIAPRLGGPARENRKLKKPSPRTSLKRKQKSLPKKVTPSEVIDAHINRKKPWSYPGLFITYGH